MDGVQTGAGPVPELKAPPIYNSSLSSPRVGSLPGTGFCLGLVQQLPQNELQDAAMTEILRLLRRVEPDPGVE